ncbi:ATP-dependent RNA helicase [Plasmodium brasilianum]|uniref:ATP-dependent RNA helicase n=1 Tax=Plasmodium brasilianum TaxID=5824 RepID=A0ACB9YAT4_PLABR|nr:ATP-dependent RNA helicase [Plasmodium brasilianum]
MSNSDEGKFFEHDDEKEEEKAGKGKELENKENAKNEKSNVTKNPNEENRDNEIGEELLGKDEIDPLDQFMEEINKVIEEEKKISEKKEKLKNNYEHVTSKRDQGKESVGEEGPHASKRYIRGNGKGQHGDNDDSSLDDNNATADIYEFLEKKNEELIHEKILEDGNGKQGNYVRKSGTAAKNKSDRLDGHDGYDGYDGYDGHDGHDGYDGYDEHVEHDGFDCLQYQSERRNDKEGDKIIDDMNYEEIELEKFKKDIFITDESINNFTLEESVQYKKKNNISAVGFNVPKPIFSFLQIKNLIDKDILQNMYNLSISVLSPIQSIVIPIFLSGRDFIATSRTGSGKTLSFIISLVIHIMNCKKFEGRVNYHMEKWDHRDDRHNIAEEEQAEKEENEEGKTYEDYKSEKKPQTKGRRGCPSAHALILTPTRELCVQIYDEMNRVSMKKLKSCILFSGINYTKAYNDIQKGVDIIIANVKTLISFINKKYLSLINTKYVILDEFDKLFTNQFIYSVISILKNIRPDAIRGFFSCTCSEHICELVKPYLNKRFITIKVGDNNVFIEKKFYILEENVKYMYLLNCIQNFIKNEQCFIFCNSKKNLLSLYDRLKKEISLRHISMDYIYGDIDQTQRIYKFECLKKKKTQIMISTDLMARGIDVVDLNFVINYDCPNDIFIYIHRIGRCSRMNSTGMSTLFHYGVRAYIHT